MSRRPKPTAIRELEGDVGHHRKLPGEEPKPQIGAPEMPKGMGLIAKRHWRRYERVLLQLGVLSVVDGAALAEACKSAALSEIYFKKVIEKPTVTLPIFDKEGAVIAWKEVANPLAADYVKMSKNMKAFQIEFGLTPASRVKLRVEKKPDADQEMPSKEETTLPSEEMDLSSIDETVVVN